MGIESKIKAHSILSTVQHGSCEWVRARSLCSVLYACVYRRSGSRSKADIIITKQKCRSIRLVARAGTASVAPAALPLLPPFAGSTPSTTLYMRVEYTLSDRRHINSFSVFAFDFIQFEYIFGFGCVSGVWVFLGDYILYAFHTRFSFPIISFAFCISFASILIRVSVCLHLVCERIFGCWPSQSAGNSYLFSILWHQNSLFDTEWRLQDYFWFKQFKCWVLSNLICSESQEMHAISLIHKSTASALHSIEGMNQRKWNMHTKCVIAIYAPWPYRYHSYSCHI